MLIPSFLFNASAIEKRKPLSTTARRAGWIGCNILLSGMPDLGKLRIVDSGSVVEPRTIRDQYQRIRPLADLAPKVRGWTLDVLQIVQSLGQRQFSLSDIYAHESRLQALHLANRNVRPKIRQQLQVLRDMGIISFFGNGRYGLVI
jgi:type II restriction enzyme